jgi:serine/threonine-protein kinase
MLTKAGAKLLDFGLAKAAAPIVDIVVDTTQQTASGHLTGNGTILGTIHYMAPEQVEGREADARSDIWAFGAVLYEMVCRTRPFDGDSSASIIGAILKDTPPPVSARQPLSPPALDHIVDGCLAKDPDERWQTAADIKRELRWISTSGSRGVIVAPRGTRPRMGTLAGIVGGALLGVVISGTLAFELRPRSAVDPAAVMKFDVMAPPHTVLASPIATLPSPQLSLSPDGKWLAFVARSSDSDAMLWMRPVDGTTATQITGTEDASYPFWSPDSRSVAFFAQSKLKRVDVRSGTPRILCDAVDPRGGTWSSEDLMVIALSRGGLWRIPASGGALTPVTTVTSDETGHRWPAFLPDGHHILFHARLPRSIESTVNVVNLDGTGRKQLLTSQFGAIYVGGQLLSLSSGVLSAQPFDTATLALRGEAIPIAQHVSGATVNYGSFSVSGTPRICTRCQCRNAVGLVQSRRKSPRDTWTVQQLRRRPVDAR